SSATAEDVTIRNVESNASAYPREGDPSMAEPIATVDEPLSTHQVLYINEVCDQFEATWKNAASAGQRPQIEGYLADTADPLRSILLRHLLALDIDYRRLKGDCPAASDYQPRFPSLSSRFLDEVFPRPDE